MGRGDGVAIGLHVTSRVVRVDVEDIRLAHKRQYGYPLSPVSEMPSMNVRWVKKKAITIGMVTIVLTAIK